MHVYKIWLAVHPTVGDTRPFPSKERCLEMMDELGVLGEFQRIQLERDKTVTVDLDDEAIVRFHHLRRAYGACPRVKWKCVD